MLVAAVLGVQLGQSAIAEINPIHFQGAASAAARDRSRCRRPPPDAFAAAYGWDEGQAARAADCGGDCDARQARHAIASLDAAASYSGRRALLARRHADAEPAPWRAGETGAPQPASSAICTIRSRRAPAEAADDKRSPDDEESGED